MATPIIIDEIKVFCNTLFNKQSKFHLHLEVCYI